MIAVSYGRQLLPGTFEHALSYLIDNEIDLERFAARFRNDDTGAPAYDPAVVLKVVLFAYSRGITSSRTMARTCAENVVFIALACDQQPHFTTLANFVATLGKEVEAVFRDVLMVCNTQGLIGKAKLLAILRRYRQLECGSSHQCVPPVPRILLGPPKEWKVTCGTLH